MRRMIPQKQIETLNHVEYEIGEYDIPSFVFDVSYPEDEYNSSWTLNHGSLVINSGVVEDGLALGYYDDEAGIFTTDESINSGIGIKPTYVEIMADNYSVARFGEFSHGGVGVSIGDVQITDDIDDTPQIFGNGTFVVGNNNTASADTYIWLDADGVEISGGGIVKIPDLPTSDPHVADALWNDNGTLKVSSGN